ncbi:MAG: hypothetical protein HY318_16820 [Armatimonadetes bacterium]|nr:hypothetical protein [Armatimonadota bacterium]
MIALVTHLGVAVAHAAAGRPANGLIRGIYADPGAAVDNRLWASYGAGWEEDQTERYAGKVSARCANESSTETHGAELLELLFERFPSTRDICGYGDGVVRSHEWAVCSDPEGTAGYALTRETGIF